MTRRLLALLLTVTFLLGGCTDYKNLNTVAFALGLSIDLTENHDLRVTLQFPLPGLMKGGEKGTGSQGGGSRQFFLVVGEGPTFPDALAEVQARLSRPLSFGHLQALLISEELARAGRKDLLDQLWRFPEIDKLSYVLVVRGGTAADALQVVPPHERLPALYVNTAMATIERTRSQAYPSTLIHALVQGLEAGRDLIVTVAVPDNDRLLLDRVAIFRETELIVILEPDETLALMIALGEASNYSVTLGPDDGTYVVRRMNSRRRTARVERGPSGGYALRLAITVNGEVAGKGGFGPEPSIEELEQKTATVIRQRLIHLLKRLQENGVDPIGFFARTYGPTLHGESWRERLRTADLEVSVTANLARKGTVE